jgi:hypothetical protein
MAHSLLMLSWLASELDDPDLAEQHAEECLPLARETGFLWVVGGALNMLGRVAVARGDSATARLRFGEALELRREIGDARGQAAVLQRLAGMDEREGKIERARRLYHESVLLERPLEAPGVMYATLRDLAWLEMEHGSAEAARPLLQEFLVTALKIGRRTVISEAIEAVAVWERVRGGRESLLRATRLLAAALAARNHQGPTREKERTALREALGDDAFAAAWDAGSRLTYRQAAAEAMDAVHDEASL